MKTIDEMDRIARMEEVDLWPYINELEILNLSVFTSKKHPVLPVAVYEQMRGALDDVLEKLEVADLELREVDKRGLVEKLLLAQSISLIPILTLDEGPARKVANKGIKVVDTAVKE
jgi:hypothetical protein